MTMLQVPPGPKVPPVALTAPLRAAGGRRVRVWRTIDRNAYQALDGTLVNGLGAQLVVRPGRPGRLVGVDVGEVWRLDVDGRCVFLDGERAPCEDCGGWGHEPGTIHCPREVL